MARGFTLVETMVAVAVVTIATIGPLYAVQKGVTASYVSRDRLIASSLAQEGIEYVHGIRDGNYLYNLANPVATPLSWLYGIDGTGGSQNCTTGATCTIDTTLTPTTAVVLCPVSPGVCPPLRLTSSYLYKQTASTSDVVTRFTRTVKLTSVSAREMKVTVTVSWITARVPYSVTVVEILQNWL